jgi:uncharacterized protein YndB with AHSA1/START domain
MIEAQATLEISKPAVQVFALIDDLSKAPLWLESCIELRQTNDKPRVVGTPLHYEYRQGGRAGAMDGVVTAYDPGRQLAMRFTDDRFEVAIDFRLSASGSGTLVGHTVAITPKSLLGRLMSPLIQLGNRKQVVSNLARAKEILEWERDA